MNTLMPIVDGSFLGYNIVFWYGMGVIAVATAIFVTVCWCLPPKKGVAREESEVSHGLS